MSDKNVTGSTLRSRVAGTLIGLAAGDLIGGPTRMAVMCLKSLLDTKPEFSPDDLFRRFVQWYDKDAFDSGPVFMHVMREFKDCPSREGNVFEYAQRAHVKLHGMTAGCNPAHRVPVFAMVPWLVDDRLEQGARLQALLTHVHPAASDAAVSIAVACRRGIMEHDRIRNVDASTVTSSALHSGGFAPDVVEAAFHFYSMACNQASELLTKSTVSPQPLDFAQIVQEALTASIRFAGPSNYCPVLVGALLGSTFGAEAFATEDALAHHEPKLRQEVFTLGATVADMWAGPDT
jgi:ADP-ribosylglycohydrolase